MKTPPPASAVSRTIGQSLGILLDPELTTNYREAWFATVDSLRGSGTERSSRSAAGTEYADPSGDMVADNEARRKSLLRASVKLEEALKLLRDAKGLCAYANGLGSTGTKQGTLQVWTKGEMDDANGELPPYKGRVRAG